jgi:RIO-like serine/threonine protein kinase
LSIWPALFNTSTTHLAFAAAVTGRALCAGQEHANREDNRMNTVEITGTAVPNDVQADFEAIVEHLQTGKPLDASVEHRVAERAKKIREDILEKHGVQEIGVQIIRDLRGELPEP